jgi:hypothetical protein
MTTPLYLNGAVFDGITADFSAYIDVKVGGIVSPGTGTVAINTNVNVSQPGILSVGTTTNNSYILFNGKKLYVTVTDPAIEVGNTVAAGDIWISSA